MDREQELWACALQVERQHGKDASRFIDQRIHALTSTNDADGAAVWRKIGDRLEQLRQAAAPN